MAVKLRSGAWNVVKAAASTGSTELWRHGKGFVTECVNAGVVTREGTEAVLTDLGHEVAAQVTGTTKSEGVAT